LELSHNTSWILVQVEIVESDMITPHDDGLCYEWRV